METETAFVCTEGGIVLNTITEVHLGLTLIVNPNNAELEDTVGLDKTLDNLSSLVLRMLVIFFFNSLQDLTNGLQVLVFARMFGFQVSHNFVYFHDI